MQFGKRLGSGLIGEKIQFLMPKLEFQFLNTLTHYICEFISYFILIYLYICFIGNLDINIPFLFVLNRSILHFGNSNGISRLNFGNF